MATTAITVSIQRCQILAFMPHDCSMPKLDAAVAFASELNMPVELCREIYVDTHVLDEIVKKLVRQKWVNREKYC